MSTPADARFSETNPSGGRGQYHVRDGVDIQDLLESLQYLVNRKHIFFIDHNKHMQLTMFALTQHNKVSVSSLEPVGTICSFTMYFPMWYLCLANFSTNSESNSFLYFPVMRESPNNNTKTLVNTLNNNTKTLVNIKKKCNLRTA